MQDGNLHQAVAELVCGAAVPLLVKQAVHPRCGGPSLAR